jgi:hypothetical protein
MNDPSCGCSCNRCGVHKIINIYFLLFVCVPYALEALCCCLGCALSPAAAIKNLLLFSVDRRSGSQHACIINHLLGQHHYLNGKYAYGLVFSLPLALSSKRKIWAPANSQPPAPIKQRDASRDNWCVAIKMCPLAFHLKELQIRWTISIFKELFSARLFQLNSKHLF